LGSPPDGSPIHPGLICAAFPRFATQLDLPRVQLHDVRNTHPTILLHENVDPKVVSERLGHSSIAFTMTVGQHVMPGMQAEAAATLRRSRVRRVTTPDLLLSRRHGAP